MTILHSRWVRALATQSSQQLAPKINHEDQLRAQRYLAFHDCKQLRTAVHQLARPGGLLCKSAEHQALLLQNG
ncbi:unnamed protein product [Caretta caretta]